MSVRRAAAMIISTHGDIEEAIDIKVCVNTASLISEYMNVSGEAKVKLRIKNSSHPITAFRPGMQAIQYSEKTTSIQWLSVHDAKFAVYSFKDFDEFLKEAAGDLNDQELF